MTGKIIKGIGGFYYVYVEGSGLYECKAKGIFRNKKIKPSVGDVVDIAVISEADKEGNITKIHGRKNQLLRPMAANVDQAVVVFSVHEPEPNLQLLNRFLISMGMREIPVIICFNKADLAEEGAREHLLSVYRNSGYPLIFTSASGGEGIEELRDRLRGKTTVLAGPSGVGKSSVLNCISKDRQMETGPISEKLKRGKHTTRHAELIYIGDAGFLIDTPGFSSLYLEGLEKEDLRFYFPEFAPYENRCRFHGCSHIHEPGCAVKQALEGGEISPERYRDYCYLYEELGQAKKW